MWLILVFVWCFGFCLLWFGSSSDQILTLSQLLRVQAASLLDFAKTLEGKGENTMVKRAEAIEFEEITLRVPKAVLDFIDRFYGNPKEHLEHDIVNWIRVDLEAINGQELAERFNLQQVFKAILGEAI